jgi:glyoxylase-like metal-dependent hydrolase (beta-lactamase superfamily II)
MENKGFIANAGFIVGAEGVIVIDTGASYRHGEAMLAAIARVTPKPVKQVIITHAVQDFVFGAAAFVERGIPMLTHRKTAELMRARCEHCLGNLRKVLGDEIMAGTRLIIPEQLIDASATMRIAGREIDFLHFGWASTPGDLVVLDRESGVMFAGGIVTASRVPEIRDGQLRGWLDALTALRKLGARRVVPGYGRILSPDEMGQTAEYLRRLDAKMRDLYSRGVGLMEAVDGSGMDAYGAWSQYPDVHRRNALHRYLQIELEDLEG